MRWILLALLALCVTCGCDEPRRPCPVNCPRPCNTDGGAKWLLVGGPGMDLPVELRQRNYSGGSCVHASMVSVLRWQGLDDMADWWRTQYRGGESLSGCAQKADAAGLRFAYTGQGDAEFLEWASRTRRGAMIFYKPNHAITFCGYENDQAVLMDNNRPNDYERVPKAEFVQRWKGYGGVALTVVYTPAPPEPKL